LKPFDLDGDGKLSESEAAAVQAAIDAGTLVLPDRHARKLAPELQPYDTDNDGVLSETEQAAVQAAIADGSLVFRPPAGAGGRDGGRPGGRGGDRPH
jgi:hypothetical protein